MVAQIGLVPFMTCAGTSFGAWEEEKIHTGRGLKSYTERPAKEASYCEVTALHYDATYRVFVLSNISCIVSGESNLFLSLLCSSWWVLTLTTSKLPSLHRSFAFCLPALARGYPHEQKIWVDVSANIYNLCFDSVEIWRSGRLIAGNNGGSFSDLQI